MRTTLFAVFSILALTTISSVQAISQLNVT